MKKQLTRIQKRFRKSIFEELKPELQWLNDCINIRVDFKDKEHFHLHIIEDYECHLHVRGIFDGDYIQSITSVINHSVSRDVLDDTMEYLRDNF